MFTFNKNSFMSNSNMFSLLCQFVEVKTKTHLVFLFLRLFVWINSITCLYSFCTQNQHIDMYPNLQNKYLLYIYMYCAYTYMHTYICMYVYKSYLHLKKLSLCTQVFLYKSICLVRTACHVFLILRLIYNIVKYI